MNAHQAAGEGVGNVRQDIGNAVGRTGGPEKAASQGDQRVGQAKEGLGNLTDRQPRPSDAGRGAARRWAGQGGYR